MSLLTIPLLHLPKQPIDVSLVQDAEYINRARGSPDDEHDPRHLYVVLSIDIRFFTFEAMTTFARRIFVVIGADYRSCDSL